MKTRAAITAVNGYVPEFKLSNKVLETMVETSDAWMIERTGITERRIQTGKDQGLSVMAVEAVNGLLKKRGIGADEIDLMIVATVTPIACSLQPPTSSVMRSAPRTLGASI